ncbi:metallophosphoesterase [Puniceibacterium antarcticum]|uniref:metallophosphoesterase n=1 Tax=Puniceibacterium antarcticum TaxID=1206336 RepID=UPI0015D4C588|nr:metallophosphoesterase [Puniceibacterium antarcticum]
MTKAKYFRWLHLSDLHIGASNLDELWPRVNEVFLKDLTSLLNRSGPVDLIVFSGDMVNKGLVAEFRNFDQVITKILDHIEQTQNRPQIITIPGNHDLERPKVTVPEAIAFTQYWSHEPFRNAFWKRDRKYDTFLKKVFKNYSSWVTSAIDSGTHAKPEIEGILPGDASYVIDNGQCKVGVNALNSTWLQLSGSNYEGELHVDVRQLHAITGKNAGEWVEKQEINLLVTHQPASWLRTNSPSTWDNDVFPAGRYDLHLFGHMHDPITRSSTVGGGKSKIESQAASLFGLQHYGNNRSDRIQGYSLNEICLNGASRVFKSWPRILEQMANGTMKMVQDNTQDLDDVSGSFSISYIGKNAPTFDEAAPIEIITQEQNPIELNMESDFDIEILRQSPSSAKAHAKVRHLEQELCVKSLKQDRAVWLASDWGMGLSGFLSSIVVDLNVRPENIFFIDMSAYQDRDAFFDSFRNTYGATFQSMCESLSIVGPSVLVLDDVDATTTMHVEKALTSDIEEFCQTISDFAPEAFLAIRCRKLPRKATISVVELKPLDEPDLATYVVESEFGSDAYGKPSHASILYRHTDGVPSRVDAALRDLEFMSIDDLLRMDPDFSDNQETKTDAPAALVATIRDMQLSDDDAVGRAYQLLLALSALPRGEQLVNLKRFLGPHPIGPIHARILHERSLIDMNSLAFLDGVQDASTRKVVSVPRPVRDYVREITEQTRAKEIDVMALNLFFGSDWKTGEISKSKLSKRVRLAVVSNHELVNANALIFRALRRALATSNLLDIKAAVLLATSFISKLKAGSHYRSANLLCEDIIGLIGETADLGADLNFIRYEQARALRMMGRTTDAQVIFDSLNYELLNKPQKQQAKLGLALCFESQGDILAAAEAAKQTISISRGTAPALHAEIILAEQIEDKTEMLKVLSRLLQRAEAKQNHVVAANIRFKVAEIGRNNGENVDNLIRAVLQNSALKGDAYNSARAIVDLAEGIGQISLLSNGERTRLIEAYHYLYNERLFNLFDRCHSALWRVFEDQNQKRKSPEFVSS